MPYTKAESQERCAKPEIYFGSFPLFKFKVKWKRMEAERDYYGETIEVTVINPGIVHIVTLHLNLS